MARQYTDASITTITGLQHMRKHTGMWSFDRDSQQGLFQMVKEVLDNSIDEASIDSDNQHTINVTFLRQPSSYQVVIEDTGRGIPLNKLHDSFLELFTSAKDERAYSKTIGTYGVGVKATTALSSLITAVSKRAEGSSIVTAVKGKCILNEVKKKRLKNDGSFGTTVMFEPDTSIMSQTKHFFDDDGGYHTMIDLMQFACVLCHNVTFNVYIGKGRLPKDSALGDPLDVLATLKEVKQSCKLEHVCSGGMTPAEYLKYKYDVTAPTVWESGTFVSDLSEEGFNYHVEFFLTKDYSARNGHFLSAINAIQMLDKRAVQFDGAVSSIKKQLVEFIEDKDLKSYFLSSYTLPMQIVTLAWNDNASFENQAKTSYKDKKFLDKYTRSLDRQFEKLDRVFWDRLFTILSEDIETKYHRYNNRGMNIGGSMKNLAYGLNKPGAYCACRCKDPSKIELFITEGDSSGDTIKQICDRETQAIFKLGGKPINPYKKDIRDVRANLVYQDLLKVLGVSPGDKDLSNLNFNRIGILADADSDGYHITALVIGILYNINPLIVTEGRVFLSTPPLYILGNNIGNKTMFVRDKQALMDSRASTARRILDMSVSCGKNREKLNDDEFRALYYLVYHIGSTIRSIAKRLAIDPSILEMLIHCVPYLENGIDTAGIKKRLKLDHCEYLKDNNSLVLISGNMEHIAPLRNVVHNIKAFLLPSFGPLAVDRVSIYITTRMTKLYKNEPVTVTGLFDIFRDIDELFTTSRMKGLGQMPKPILRQTCLDTSTRTFVTITGVGDVEDIYKVLGVDTKARKELVNKYVSGDDDILFL